MVRNIGFEFFLLARRNFAFFNFLFVENLLSHLPWGKLPKVFYFKGTTYTVDLNSRPI
jgi:hypothetical protein